MQANDVSLTARPPAPGRERLEHVGQEHAAAHGRRQRRAGAGRRARSARASLRLTPLAVGATLRIQDSLQEGRSRFYRRDHARPRARRTWRAARPPLLFLLDELFHGTNSHDRLVGASGVLRSLLDRGAIGLITTHDLALTAIVDDARRRARPTSTSRIPSTAREMHFDYRVKPGPVTKSNALALMRAVGLDVEEAQGSGLKA